MAAIAAPASFAESPTLVDHPSSQFKFLPAIPAYSSGVVARDGHEIVHAAFLHPRPVKAGFKAIEDHLASLKLKKTALCAVELRLPHPLSLEDFGAFNLGYINVLKSWGILLAGGVNPVARTNVAPIAAPPPEPSFHGFSYVTKSAIRLKTFVVAGSGEIGDLDAGDVVEAAGVVGVVADTVGNGADLSGHVAEMVSESLPQAWNAGHCFEREVLAEAGDQ